jgi:methionyl-tRNA synthetase
MLAFDLTEAVAAFGRFIRDANRHPVAHEPWNLAKDPERRQELADVIYAELEALRVIAVFASPLMPQAAELLWAQLGVDEPLDAQRLPAASQWGLLSPGTKTNKGEPLFPRLDR